jgi:chromosome segregation ATPase
MKHTKGPWYAIDYGGYWSIQSEDEYSEGDLLNEEKDPNAEANARLAAKAPELYEQNLTLQKQIEELMLDNEHLRKLAESGVTVQESLEQELEELREENEKLKKGVVDSVFPILKDMLPERVKALESQLAGVVDAVGLLDWITKSHYDFHYNGMWYKADEVHVKYITSYELYKEYQLFINQQNIK